MKPTKKPIQTGLKIDVRPISDKGLTEEEYRAKVADIQKQHEAQDALNKVAEEHFAQRKPRGPVKRQQQPHRSVPRRVTAYTQPMRGLLHVDDQPPIKGFMGLLTTTPDGSKG